MTRASSARRFIATVVVFAPVAAFGALAGCTSSSGTATGRVCGAAGAVCPDGSILDASLLGAPDAADSGRDASDGGDGAVGRDATPPSLDAELADGASDAGTPDASNEAAPPSDAGAAVDAYADADPNCGDYAKPAGGSPTSVRVVNMRSTPIYLAPPGCDDYDIGFSLTTDAGARYRVGRTNCEATCGELQTQACSACTPSCAPPAYVTLVGPGKSFEYGWPGTVFVDAWMPPSCYADAGCVPDAGTCLEEIAAPSAFTVTAAAYSGIACDAGFCTCTPGTTGSCIISEATVSGSPTIATATWAPGQSVVQVQIE